MKKVKISIVLSLTLVFLLSSCTTVKVEQAKKESGFTLANYKTYDFQVVKLDTTQMPVYSKRIGYLREELIKQLDLSGLERSTENPDLLINVGLVMEEKIQTRETDFPTDAVYTGARNYGWESEQVEVGRYKEGTFTIDFVDAKDNKLKAMGVAKGIKLKKDENAQKNIAKGLANLFKKFN